MSNKLKDLSLKVLISIFLLVAIIVPFSASPEVEAKAEITPISVVELINDYRDQHGLSELSYNSTLAETADAKSRDIIIRDYWAHTAPDGYGFKNLLASSDYKYKIAGENLAFGYETSKEVIQAWIDSPTHNAVLLHPDFKDIGIGVETGNFMGLDDITVVAAHLALAKPNAIIAVGNLASFNLDTHLANSLKLPRSSAGVLSFLSLSKISLY